MADRTLRNPIIKRALLTWALKRLRPDGDPDAVREAVEDMDTSLTYEELLSKIAQAYEAGPAAGSSGDPYWRVASQLDLSEMRSVPEELIERQEALASAEMIREAIEKGLITEGEANLYLQPPPEAEAAAVEEYRRQVEKLRELVEKAEEEKRRLAGEAEKLREELGKLRKQAQEGVEKLRVERDIVDRVSEYIAQRVKKLGIPPMDAVSLYEEINPNLSYEDNLRAVELRLSEILREIQMKPPPAPSPAPSPSYSSPPTPGTASPRIRGGRGGGGGGGRFLPVDLSRVDELLEKDLSGGLTQQEKAELNRLLRELEDAGYNVKKHIEKIYLRKARWEVKITYPGGHVSVGRYFNEAQARRIGDAAAKAGAKVEIRYIEPGEEG